MSSHASSTRLTSSDVVHLEVRLEDHGLSLDRSSRKLISSINFSASLSASLSPLNFCSLDISSTVCGTFAGFASAQW